MKSKLTPSPTRSQFSVLRQLRNLIPPHLVPKLARETGVDAKARTFSPGSHVVSLIYAHHTHAIGLNDICDAIRLHSGMSLVKIDGKEKEMVFLTNNLKWSPASIADL